MRRCLIGQRGNGRLEVGQTAKLFFHFAKDRVRKCSERAHETRVVDGAALIDHDLALLPVPGNPPRQEHSEHALPREPGGAGQDPGRRM